MKFSKSIFYTICTSAHLHIRTLLILLFFSQNILANPVDSVGTKNSNGKRFVLYQIDHQETWYRISKKYGISVKELQGANKDVVSKPLSVGQVLLVPVGAAPTQHETKMPQPGDKPLIQNVKDNETLYSIAVSKGVTMRDIRIWNNLKSDNLQNGQKLIVGYENKKNEKQQAIPKQVRDSTKQVIGGSDKPMGFPGLVKDAKEEKKIPSDTLKKGDTGEWKMPPAKGTPLEEHGMATFIEDEDINPHKYYALHRTAPTGTIIKVTNIMKKKQIYVKVVGKLPDTGDNDNVIIKISKASAMKLGILDSHFQVILNYYGE